MDALGRHLLVEFTDCDAEHLADVDFIQEAMLEAARKSGATILAHSFHHFSPPDGRGGVSGAVIIAESHLAIHTWPEYRYAAADFFTCGETVDPWKAYDFLQEALKAKHGSAVEFKRGQLHIPNLRYKPDDSALDFKTRSLGF